jgi:tetratricopeptide (TPR) repeat protein
MMRAYGDRELFQRFRTRLILAPIVLLAAVIWSTHYSLDAVMIVLLLWGLWHGMMQVFGFCRIYDAKYKSFNPWTARLDWWMCLTWFTVAVVWSPARMGLLLGTWNKASGGMMLSASWLDALRWGWAGITLAVTVAFIFHTGLMIARGKRPSPLKLLNMFTSFAFWIYVSLMVDNIVLGVALFEVFHDVQYLAIVWVYNRARVDRGTNAGSFTRFLFRRSGLMVGLYLGMIFAYGYLYMFAKSLDQGTVRLAVTSVLATSTLFHFYLDGFIWKVREQSTRQSLSLDEKQQSIPSAKPPWLVHGAKWAFFLVPVLLLGVAELAARDQNYTGQATGVASSWASQVSGESAAYASKAQLQYSGYVARIYPESWNAHASHAAVLTMLGKHAQAEQSLRLALQLYPYDAMLQNGLGASLILQGKSDQAQPAIEAALDLDPRLAQAHSNLGVIKANRGEMSTASQHFTRALQLDPDYVHAHIGMADFYSTQGQHDKAADQLQRAVTVDPMSFRAQVKLGIALSKMKAFKKALAHLHEASQIKPDDPLSYLEAGIILLKLKQFEAAMELLTRAAMPGPLQAKAVFYQAVTLQALSRPGDAARAYRRAMVLQPDNVMIVTRLESLYAANGQFEQAISVAQQAIQLTSSDQQAAPIRRRIEGYRREQPVSQPLQ